MKVNANCVAGLIISNGMIADWFVSLCIGRKKENISMVIIDGFQVGGGGERPLSRVLCCSQRC